MAFFDMPLEQLWEYRPKVQTPPDFDEFWKKTLQETRSYELNPEFTYVDYGLKLVETYDVTFSGYGGQRVKAWFVIPVQREGKLPCVVEFIGYGGGRGFGFEHLLFANMGYAYLIMDTRGQGSVWRHGDTADIPSEGANPSAPGFMTQGILRPETYYYRRVFTDAVRAIETVRTHTAVDTERIALTGGSQGGGITIAAGALTPDVAAVIPDVPFLCHYQRAISIIDTMPYGEIVNYLKSHRDHVETVLNTLSYFDGVNFAQRIRAKALFSVGLMDTVCPPSTVFAAYNYLQSEVKNIKIYPYNNHEGGGNHHTLEKTAFLNSLWG